MALERQYHGDSKGLSLPKHSFFQRVHTASWLCAAQGRVFGSALGGEGGPSRSDRNPGEIEGNGQFTRRHRQVILRAIHRNAPYCRPACARLAPPPRDVYMAAKGRAMQNATCDTTYGVCRIAIALCGDQKPNPATEGPSYHSRCTNCSRRQRDYEGQQRVTHNPVDASNNPSYRH